MTDSPFVPPRDRPAIEITPQMIEAGKAVLWQSGIDPSEMFDVDAILQKLYHSMAYQAHHSD